MTSPKTQVRSLARRLALLSVAMLAAVLVLTSGIMAVVAEGRSRDRVVLWVGDKTQSVADSVDAFDATARMMTDRAYKPFRRKYADEFELSEDGTMLTSWGMLLNGDFTEVDQFHEQSGGVATVFMRKGDDFERITTSLKRQDGERATGTLLDRNHPAYRLMLEGKTYTGRAVLFGKPYMTHYEPVRNAAGQVVAILFIGFDMTDFQKSLEQVVGEARFFDTGATYVVDPRSNNADAVFVVHPSAAGKKVLEVYPEADAMLTRLRAEPNAFVMDPTPLLGVSMGDPWLVKRQAKAGNWWVMAEVSDDEAMVSHWSTIYAFWALLALAAVAIGVALFWLIRKMVSRPLHELTTAVTTVAQGDLSRGFTSNRSDEIGQLITEVEGMRQRFNGIVQQLRSATDSINVASQEIAAGNQDLSSRTEQAASNLEETAASMEELTSTVKNSADAARQANQLAASAAEVAARGGQVVGQVVSTMDEINHSSKKIADIIGVIDGIAFQTNILALNAAVEAARAGEQGRGFAVVAGEVRNLAQRSAEAAKEIKGLIGTSVDKVEVGSRLVADAGQTMEEIVGSVQRVSDIIGEITAAAGEQSEGIGQVNTAVNQLDQMTQQNAALVEQSAAAAQSLKDQAHRLAEVIRVFRVDGAPAPSLELARPVSASQPVAKPAAVPATPARALPKAAPAVTMASKPPVARPPAANTPARSATPATSEGEWESF